ncbi:hypothetical protein L198_05313 [Cryptococcus wingfieldii CBS 7118]|uniref:F-box domain-containing protein n=1 Tax=Cryptococcus wingfieldii CBS 7118 TaxID=1295528 RepID=A0A1E3IY22_9TREE|nr:hypothetical protein L198_05313 [Cryptococcus wingfieldii CBS 7118]ODN93448.1 hypothetical protein L198_05313 [Cryptococcus wingfieldii CBS 7118]
MSTLAPKDDPDPSPSSPPSAIPARLKSKQNQQPTNSPNTAASNRRRLGGLFAEMGISVSPARARAVSESPAGTPSRKTTNAGSELVSSVASSITSFADRMAALSMVASGGNAKTISSPVKEGTMEGRVSDEGCFVDACSVTSLEADTREHSDLEVLSDDLLLEIFLHLDTADNLHVLSQVSKRFYNLSRAPILWMRICDSTGYRDDLRAEVDEQALGVWEAPDAGEASTTGTEDGSIPIHYPTFYHTMSSLPQHIRSLKPTHHPVLTTIPGHTDSIYALQMLGQWLFTGSRDRSIRLWRLPAPSLAKTSQGAELAASVEDAHGGSVLSLVFECDLQGRGLLVTSSSDETASIWSIFLPQRPSDGEATIEKLQALPHPAAVLDAALTPAHIVTACKDRHLRVFSRTTLEQVWELKEHRGPINCVTVHGTNGKLEGDNHEEVISASGDGSWIIWDVKTGKQVRRGAGDGRGLACVAWERDYIVTGDNECLIKLYDAATCNLIKVFQGHTNLVRAVALRPREGLVVSGSYDHSVMIWDMHTGLLIKRPSLPHTSLVLDIHMSANRLASAGHDNSVMVLTWGGDLPYTDLLV